MKKITSTHKDPIVLALRDSQFGRFTSSQNLLPGSSIIVKDLQLSPECKVLEKKRVITISDVAELAADTKVAVEKSADVVESKSTRKAAKKSANEAAELAALEKQLLGDTNSDTEEK